jgi:hypothetical protein
MAYYIFLKSLRSLEEFRKNPHVNIPPKSPSTNLQSLGKFKNLIFNSEIPFPYFRPGQPCGPLGHGPSKHAALAAPAGRTPPPSPAHPARASVASLWEYVFPFGSRLPSWPRLLRLSVKRASAVSSLTSGRPCSPAPPPLPGHPAPPSSAPRVPPSRYRPAFIFPPLIPLIARPPCLQWR